MFQAMFVILVVAFVIAIVGTAIFLIVGCIYIIPFSIWISNPEVKAVYGEATSNKSGFKQLHYATVYYKHYLFNKELTF